MMFIPERLMRLHAPRASFHLCAWTVFAAWLSAKTQMLKRSLGTCCKMIQKLKLSSHLLIQNCSVLILIHISSEIGFDLISIHATFLLPNRHLRRICSFLVG